MDSQGGSMDSMLPVPMYSTEEIRRIVREEVNRRNRPASISCFERTQNLMRGAATAVSRNINRQTVPPTSSSIAAAFRSGIASINQQLTTSSINEVWAPWRTSGNKRRGNPSHPGSLMHAVIASWLMGLPIPEKIQP